MKSNRWQNCNVLSTTPERRRLWRFHRSGKKIEAAGKAEFELDTPLPPGPVGKTIRHLWQPRLNVAWLPANQVFLRVIHFPPCDPKELPGMVELQLEALSPLPLAQIVWSFEKLTAPADQPQTLIVILAAREAVEDFLGGLEGAGYLADRLELPQLRELLITQGARDGVWIYPRAQGQMTVCLVAWYEKDGLRSLNLLSLPADETAGNHLAALLRQLAWAAEMEGWLAADARWRLVTDEQTAAILEPPLREFAASGMEVVASMPERELAQNCATSAGAANLVPEEIAHRYQQQFLDGLWMRALFALAALYTAGVLVYFGIVKFVDFQNGRVDNQVQALRTDYAAAQKLKAKVEVLQDQVDLKYSALDCFKAASEALPDGLMLTHLTFQRGRKLGLFGTVPMDQQASVTEYTEALQRVLVGSEPVFSEVGTPSIQAPLRGRETRPATWSLDCTINREDF